jgi:hypothetical protein
VQLASRRGALAIQVSWQLWERQSEKVGVIRSLAEGWCVSESSIDRYTSDGTIDRRECSVLRFLKSVKFARIDIVARI